MHRVRRLSVCCLLAALTGCIAGGPATPHLHPDAMTDAPHPIETRFPTPLRYLDDVAAAASSMPPQAAPDVEGVRIGRFAGYPAVLVDTGDARAAIALHGGHLLSYVPTGGEDVFWLSPRLADAPAAIRGGVPVVWPFFGRQGQNDDVPSHGFVRTLRWHLVDAARDADGSVALTLAPPRHADLGLALLMHLRIGRTLEQTLETTNTGDVPVAFTQALHSYFRVSDVADVQVEGLDGLRFLDKNDAYAAHAQTGDWVLDDDRDPGRSDYIYTDAGGRYRLDDPGLDRRIELTTSGSHTLVVWNPGEASAERGSDMNDGAWRDFLCLEAANAGPDIVRLAPGKTHRLTQRVRVLPRD
ncbi:putative glucose-6-phosphate 1-epimerase [Luteimonas sp. 9C]|uniref:D-hexose-6-phosphate mutarotase n=1 Tax=Luteimonas sp. 9C TaxID=2653148 RepID=UPI0012F240D8|nr:D-hexose-6-phosphate mutarotase [Luteimonas sp. 9C]VXB23390.1 putative glucose-6-phosphate 1-epimerase [Luteimonas sp. 9C]